MESNDVAPKRKDNKQRAYLGNTKLHNELSNPCIKEGDLSRLCLEDNNYDKEPCEVYFVNYRKCRAFWVRLITVPSCSDQPETNLNSNRLIDEPNNSGCILECRSAQNKVISDRRSQGLMPYLPLPEERAEIKAKYFSSKR